MAMRTSDLWVGRVLGEGAFARVLHGEVKCKSQIVPPTCPCGGGSAATTPTPFGDRAQGHNGSPPRTATCSSAHSVVAIKVVEKVSLNKNPAARSSILQEQRILRRLNQEQEQQQRDIGRDFRRHSCVVRLLASFHDAECLYLVMECAQGTLQDAINARVEQRPPGNGRRNRPASFGPCWSHAAFTHWSYQLLQALDFIHSHGVVHCDIKPSNVLLRVQPGERASSVWQGPAIVQLCDFGSALDLTVPCPETSLSAPSNDEPPVNKAVIPRGTAEFSSPELLRGDLDSEPFAADLWSLGCVMYAEAHPQGRSPFAADSEALVVQKVFRYFESYFEGSEPLEFDSEFYRSCNGWDDIIRTLLHPDPRRRVWTEAVTPASGQSPCSTLLHHPIWNSVLLDEPPVVDFTRLLDPSQEWWRDSQSSMRDGSMGWSVFLT